MSFSEDYLNDNYESEFDEEEVKLKINTCREHIDNGYTFVHLDFIEEVIQLCLEYDFVEDGLYLAEALLNAVPYNSEAWQYKGILLNNTFSFEHANSCFEKALSLNPNDVETFINKSIAEDNLGMFEDAVKSLIRALEIEPNNEETLFNLGILYEKKEKYAEAIGYFDKSIEADPEYIE
ncbi:MAG: tetratricopeptide repeat protein, partial [Melioribacteraceae bacterium]